MIRLGYEKYGQLLSHDISASVRIESHEGKRLPSVHIETAPVFIQFLLHQLGGVTLYSIEKVEPYEEGPKDEILLCSMEHLPQVISAWEMTGGVGIPDHLIGLEFERDAVNT